MLDKYGQHIRVLERNMSSWTIVWKEEHGLLYKVSGLAYTSYACLNLYSVMLHLDGYATHFEDAMLYNDDYYMQDASCWALVYAKQNWALR